MSVASSRLSVRTARRPAAPEAPASTLVVWTISRGPALSAAAIRGTHWSPAGPEAELRALLTTAPSPTLQLILADPASPGSEVLVAECHAACVLDGASALIGVTARDARGTLLDATFAASPTAPRRTLFARTEIFARLGIEGGRYEIA